MTVTCRISSDLSRDSPLAARNECQAASGGGSAVDHVEYLLSYGIAGDFGRFRAAQFVCCQRGDRAVVRSHRGVELGEVLRAAAPRHAVFLPNTSVGQFLRLVNSDDERTAAELHRRGGEMLSRANRLAAELAVPLEVLDVELLLDREHAIVHHVRWSACDIRPFVSTLSREFGVHVALTDLTHSTAEAHNDEEHGCGEEGCGGGNCGSCGSGGGCGTCGTSSPQEVVSPFAELREPMELGRTPLL